MADRGARAKRPTGAYIAARAAIRLGCRIYVMPARVGFEVVIDTTKGKWDDKINIDTMGTVTHAEGIALRVLRGYGTIA